MIVVKETFNWSQSSSSKSKLFLVEFPSGLGSRGKLLLGLLDLGVISGSSIGLFFFIGVLLQPIASSSIACVLSSIDSLKKLSSSKMSLVFRFSVKKKMFNSY